MISFLYVFWVSWFDFEEKILLEKKSEHDLIRTHQAEVPPQEETSSSHGTGWNWTDLRHGMREGAVGANTGGRLGGPCSPETAYLFKDGAESHWEGGGYQQHHNQPEAKEKRVVWGRLLLAGKTGENRKGGGGHRGGHLTHSSHPANTANTAPGNSRSVRGFYNNN